MRHWPVWLQRALYSEDFRNLVTEVTGAGDFTDKTDCSCNVYAEGCHLLCHDDVIGTRRVSWILYLTDPDEASMPCWVDIGCLPLDAGPRKLIGWTARWLAGVDG